MRTRTDFDAIRSIIYFIKGQYPPLYAQPRLMGLNFLCLAPKLQITQKGWESVFYYLLGSKRQQDIFSVAACHIERDEYNNEFLSYLEI